MSGKPEGGLRDPDGSAMMAGVMLDLYEEFRGVVCALEAAGIPYALCGGLAVSLHTQPRATQDIDLLVEPGSLDAVKRVLDPAGYSEQSLPMTTPDGRVTIRRLTKMEKDGTDYLVVDLVLVQGLEVSAAWETRQRLPWEGRSLSVVSREGLIALKRMRGSALDLADIESLQKAEGRA